MLERPNWNIVENMLAEVTRSISSIGEAQHRMSLVTGEAWSPDRMIRAVVGPRGQLVELEINPRVLRKPDSQALAAAILATVRNAVDEASRKSAALIDQTLPAEVRERSTGINTMLRAHDSELVAGADTRE